MNSVWVLDFKLPMESRYGYDTQVSNTQVWKFGQGYRKQFAECYCLLVIKFMEINKKEKLAICITVQT